MYLSKLLYVFLQIAKCICTSLQMFVLFCFTGYYDVNYLDIASDVNLSVVRKLERVDNVVQNLGNSSGYILNNINVMIIMADHH